MLKTYREKRDFSETPEPKGRKRSQLDKSKSLTFVVQEHAATRLHFDFRLEADGVLLSWAVPKGPSLNPHEKRLAVMTEDHPLDYAGFEGIIPSGYGAGEVIVWDNGTYMPLDDQEKPLKKRDDSEKFIKAALKKGKLSFELFGQKLQGVWTLIRLKKTEKDWLLIKHEDKYASDEGHPWADDSVLTGQTLTDLQTGRKKTKISSSHKNPRVSKKKVEPTNKSKARLAKLPLFKPPMLATLATDTFASKEWLFEPKLDGIRALTYINGDGIKLYSRRGLVITQRYPELTRELSDYSDSLILDGEIVALDKNQRPSFERLQERSGLSGKKDVEQAEMDNPVIYYVFDILFAHGEDLRPLPLTERKNVLNQVVKNSQHIKTVQNMGSDGNAAFSACSANGLEGVVAKRLASPYQSEKRSADWLKMKSTQSAEFLICGYTKGTGSRKNSFGALILGEHDKAKKLVYVCCVGTGFDTKRLASLLKLMKPLIKDKCPFAIRPTGLDQPTWLEPKLVAEIKYAERTREGSLRVPVFLHLREDIEPAKIAPPPVVQIVHDKTKKTKQDANKNTGSSNQIIAKLDNEQENLELDIEGNRIALSHLNKSFWPKYKTHKTITKRDYLRYLIKVAPYLLPHLKDRLITLIRFPQGITGGKFFQKHWQENLPGFVETVFAYTEHEKKDQKFLLCNNLSTLIWLGQIADLELHTSHTRISSGSDAKKLSKTFTGSLEAIDKSLLNYPDYMVFDLDPYLYSGKESKGEEPELHRKGFRKACEAALWLKDLFDQLSIKAFIKTSGRTGLHIYVPIKRNLDYDTVRVLSQAISEHVLAQNGDALTMDWSVSKRTGKVFLDHNMNARSKSLASIYSPRVSIEATVSTPVEWQDLGNIYPTDFTIETLPPLLIEHGDLWADILSDKNDLQNIVNSSFVQKPARKRK